MMQSFLLIVVAALALAPAAAAQVRGDAESGRAIAERWCADCHVVSSEQTAAQDAPTFMEIAAAAGSDFGPLEAFLADPHPVMPDMSLTRQEIRDLVRYIASLR